MQLSRCKRPLRVYIKTAYVFIKACELAKVPASTRQAAKFLRGKGIAAQYKARAIAELAREVHSKSKVA